MGNPMGKLEIPQNFLSLPRISLGNPMENGKLETLMEIGKWKSIGKSHYDFQISLLVWKGREIIWKLESGNP